MQQTLMHLYFYAILEKLQAYQYSPAQLVKMIERSEKVCRCMFIIKHHYFVNNTATHILMHTYICSV